MTEDSVNWAAALEGLDGQRPLLLELIDLFLVEYPRLINDADVALRASDLKTLQRAAHTTKGSLRYFGPSTAADVAEKLEMAAKLGDLPLAERLFPQLQREVARLLPQLDAYRGS